MSVKHKDSELPKTSSSEYNPTEFIQKIELEHLSSEREFREVEVLKLNLDLLDSSIPKTQKETILNKIKSFQKVLSRIHAEQSNIYNQIYTTA